jgi:Putative peptidoglycan binding domain
LVSSALVVGLAACADKAAKPNKSATSAPTAKPKTEARAQPTEPPPPELLEPVDLWKDGQPSGQIDAQGSALDDHVFLDLGEGWTPILFSDGEGAEQQPLPHSFRPTYLSLARGQFKKEPFYDRARDDKYLELYGIMPTLSVLRERLHWAEKLACKEQLDLTAINTFTGVVAYEGPAQATNTRSRYLVARKYVERFLAEQGVTDPALIDVTKLKDGERAQLKYYVREHDDFEAIKAAQDRLACEGYFKGKGRWVKGAFDWATHEALAEFERRHRVYSWGAMGPDTLAALRMDTSEVEHETVVRVLTERAMHAFGAIEDGSAVRNDKPIAFTGADGKQHLVPNLQEEMRKAVIAAFGLTDPSATAAFLDGLKLDEPEGHLYVAIPGPPRPEYYSSDMDLSVVIDRGDVWYEFPYDEYGNEKPQPVSRRPHTTIVLNYLGQKFPIARFGTTIGGWKSELIDDVVFWKYKGSPWGEVLWEEIVSAPVWLPPNTTPPRDLLKRREKRKPGETKWEVNVHETGPSYASAYGLVAAYHREYGKRADGTVRLGGDDGIRSHGSVDYMSIMRRHSHGCHRLHNHIAVRLFSFVVNHRAHTREGHQPTNFVMNLEYEEEKHQIHIKQGGYAFKLAQPIFVTVEEGRIRGKVNKPVLTAIPKFNAECKAYFMPDGRAVLPRADGTLLPTQAPPCDSLIPQPPPVLDDSSPLNSPLGSVPAGELDSAETLGAASP